MPRLCIKDRALVVCNRAIVVGECGPSDLGACCWTRGCNVTTESECLSNIPGGVWRGAGTFCPDACLGACCTSGNCSQELEGPCALGGGAFHGYGVPCTPTLCVIPATCCEDGPPPRCFRPASGGGPTFNFSATGTFYDAPLAGQPGCSVPFSFNSGGTLAAGGSCPLYSFSLQPTVSGFSSCRNTNVQTQIAIVATETSFLTWQVTATIVPIFFGGCPQSGTNPIVSTNCQSAIFPGSCGSFGVSCNRTLTANCPNIYNGVILGQLNAELTIGTSRLPCPGSANRILVPGIDFVGGAGVDAAVASARPCAGCLEGRRAF